MFGHAFISASIRDECDVVRCPRCNKWMATEEYEKERYG